jgi:hypothetical protein
MGDRSENHQLFPKLGLNAAMISRIVVSIVAISG